MADAAEPGPASKASTNAFDAKETPLTQILSDGIHNGLFT